jgi:hypothetical protein
MPVPNLESPRMPYALKNVCAERLSEVCPLGEVKPGDLALARVSRIGRNTRLELASGRMSNLFEGDLLAVVFGNRYATLQFEGYAERCGSECDLLSMAGVCGIVHTKAAAIPDATRLELLGAFPMNLAETACRRTPPRRTHTIAVCGSSMDSGKTHTAASIIRGLVKAGERVAAVKLTGTASGRDTWSFYDSGARPALDFIDAGWPSTYRCTLDELLEAHSRLVSNAAHAGADWVVIEIADGLLQRETAMLLSSPEFRRSIDHWFFATGDPLAAVTGSRLLQEHGIELAAISGLISTRPLAMAEAESHTGIQVLTDKQLQSGLLIERLSCFTPRLQPVLQVGLAS